MVDYLKEVEENFEIKLSDLNFKLGEIPSLALSQFEILSLWNTLGNIIAVVEEIENVKTKTLEGRINKTVSKVLIR